MQKYLEPEAKVYDLSMIHIAATSYVDITESTTKASKPIELPDAPF